jgi:nitronate monooxygenase
MPNDLHPALRTPLLKTLGCELPIMLAGMGGVARHKLAAAVCQAGGFGVMGMVREPVALIEAEVQALRELTDRRFAVNLIPASTKPDLLRDQVAACLRLQVPAMVLFWDVDKSLVRHLKEEGVQVIHQVGNERDADLALEAGADVLIVQGYEAGGHVRGTASLFGLLPVIAAKRPRLGCGFGARRSGRELGNGTACHSRIQRSSTSPRARTRRPRGRYALHHHLRPQLARASASTGT